uniref:QdtA n=1 Tax=Thermoanaerobacterium thermosaccharolyticum TaxID=1517 RepID=UPI00065F26FF|nr:Chain A, QdtA [Thermoanaerobacterium thermosaccharolyticum]4ZU7_B Chain B, QdtA [Thermoanaerobacterium thermosaccharolyticum]4ZU7_C Chain C, QdtA [Thermoanaerobacterium thermosaccharolyticum]4ZU7_D Chain D, QdtA [Thermoanaerobacterium thermosaccharolyticum]4ZU7_E Chain E, QdtA [Thermoanaerobacterium thermosaccharolyticum]4ZU7_F Chain F, QdtA [Thermoanaerobacterium thermosaccharolyticum]4ZU7_G Chain G, QdtA [Thermoanaerobacterium thermosaccharolyticum]4ZU7_H Chain H, QdtA [Thermoanaerobact
MLYNVALIKFKDIADKRGHLTPIEGKIDIPFDIKRVYYITKVDKDITRGYHSHKKLHQVLICLNGSVKIRLKIPDEEKIIELNDPSVGLYIGPLVWHEMFDFTEGCVLLVLASEYYDETDYIRNYDFYIDEAKKRFLEHHHHHH